MLSALWKEKSTFMSSRNKLKLKGIWTVRLKGFAFDNQPATAIKLIR